MDRLVLGSALLVLAFPLGPVGYHHDAVGGDPRDPFDVAVDSPALPVRREHPDAFVVGQLQLDGCSRPTHSAEDACDTTTMRSPATDRLL